MLICLAFCTKDARPTENLLRWMHELDGKQTKHRLLLIAAFDVPEELRNAVRDAGRDAFENVEIARTNRAENRPWPRGPNMMFRCAVAYIEKLHKTHFLWHEFDCIPLCPKWLDAYEEEYLRAGKPFMGSVVTRPIRHLTGCAIYPHNIGQYNADMIKADQQAFDCVNPEATLKHTHHTQLFHHQWSDKSENDVPTFQNKEKLSIIGKESVVFHRNKDHTLIQRLREVNAATSNAWRGPLSTVAAKELTKLLGPESVLGQKSVEAIKEIIIGETLYRWNDNWNDNKESKEPLKPADISEEPKQVIEKQDHPTTPKFNNPPPIYTYYAPVPGQPKPDKLIELWSTLWKAQGWNPVVLSEDEARKQTRYMPFLEAIAKFPTVNTREYETACYLRHLAMQTVFGGVLLDYDVMPRKWTPADCASDKRLNRAITILEPTRVPCAIKASRVGFDRLVDYLENYKPNIDDTYNGQPHTSDRDMIRKTKRFVTAPVCIEYLNEGWENAAMVHFSNASMHKSGLPVDSITKVELITKILDD